MDLAAFEQLALARRSVRNFRPDPIPDELLTRLLDIAHWAPSGYNLQPTHFVIVTDPAIKQQLYVAAMNQRQILDAHATIVFTGDRNVMQNNFERVIADELRAGTITPMYEALLRKYVPLAFGHGPLGLGWLWKALGPPVARWFTPVPSIPAVQIRFWLAKQALLSAMQFMLAAEAAGLATVPMEGFDESRVRRVLNIPSSQIVCVLIPVGYAADADLRKTRLPLESMLHRDRW